jgi:hypothetical protein
MADSMAPRGSHLTAQMDGARLRFSTLRSVSNRKEMLEPRLGLAKSEPLQAERMMGNNREARRKSPRAGPFSALNCRIHSSIGTIDSEQAVIYQPPEEFREILTKQLRLGVEFA